MERTYVMLKPDAVQRNLIGKIISRIEDKGFHIAEMKMMTLSESLVREHYAHISHLPIFGELVTFMTSGKVVAMVVEGEGVIDGIRRLMGKTNTADALAGTIRGDFGFSTTYNLIHGSDSPENAEIEINRFFQ